MAAGRTEKPARFWRVGACSLIPWQSTDMQRLRRGMKAEVWEAVLYLSMGLPYLCFHTSTQTLHVSRLPGDQRTRSHPPKPRRFLRSASRHSTLIYIAWPAKKRGGLKERRPIPIAFIPLRKRCMSVDCQGIREHAPTLQNRAGFSVRPAAIAL